MKKSLSLLLALTLVFGLFASMASAADATAPTTTAEKFKFFVDAGILKGTTDGDAQLSAKLNRAQFATIAVALAGLPAATTGSTFTDVTKGQWWYGAIEAAAKADLVNGTGGNKFSPRADVTIESVIKVAVLIAGIKPVDAAVVAGSSAWAGPYIQAAIDNGLIAAGTTGFTKAATRGDTFDIAYASYEALQGPKIVSSNVVDSKNVEVTFSDKEVVKVALTTALEANKATEIAVAYKGKDYKTTVTWVVTALVVSDVKSDNLKTIVVSFSKEINDKTVSADSVKLFDGTTALTVTRYVSDDKKTVYLTAGTKDLSNAFSQMKEYKVTVNGVEAKDSTTDKVTGFEKAVKAQDVTAPTVADVKLNSPKMVEITFSEPVKFPTAALVLSQVQIDGINIYNTQSLNDDAVQAHVITGKVNLMLGNALAKGEHKIKVTGLSDFAGFPIADKEVTVTVAEDTTAPSITSAKANSVAEVEVTFDEPVELYTVQAGGNIKVEGTNIASATTVDSKTFKLTLGASLNKSAIVDAVITYKGIKDHSGNEVKDAKTFKFTVADDTTTPTVTAFVTSNNLIELTFSKSVDPTQAKTNANYEVYDKDNKKVSLISGVAQKDGSDKVYVVTFTGSNGLKGNYTLKVLADKISDRTVRGNKVDATSLALVLFDKVAPTATALLTLEGPDLNADGDVFDSKLVIFFDEAMDVSTLSNSSNYLFNGNYAGGNISITPASDGKSVTLFRNESQAGNQWSAGTVDNIKLLGLKDVAGNLLTNISVALNVGTFVAHDDFTVLLPTIEATGKNTIKITTRNATTLIASIDPNKVHFVTSAGVSIPDVRVAGVSIASDSKSVTLTLSKEIASSVGDVFLVADLNAVTLLSGTQTNATVTGAVTPVLTPLTVTDKIAPSVTDVKGNGNVFGIYYDETLGSTLATNGASIQFNLTIIDLDDDNKILVAGPTGYTVTAITGNKIVVTLAAGVANGHKLSVALANGAYVTDVATNASKAFTAKTVENAATGGDLVIVNP